MARSRKGISPVIATVIIVAVAIAISIAVAGWLFGLWGGFASAQPQIKITNPTGSASNNKIQLYITNNGAGSDDIIKVIVIKGTTKVIFNETNGAKVTFGTDDLSDGKVTIPSNSEGWLTIDLTGTALEGQLNPGDQVVVQLFFKQTSTQTLQVPIGP